MMVQAPHWMPSTAQAVTLQGEPGWFISARSVQNQGPPMMSQYGDKGKGKGKSKGMHPYEKVDNPGLDTSQPVLTGVVKCAPLPTTGYGFLYSEELQASYPGKDVFLHLKICPWVADMQLANGESVQFNYIDKDGQPQATRITRAL